MPKYLLLAVAEQSQPKIALQLVFPVISMGIRALQPVFQPVLYRAFAVTSRMTSG